MAALRVFLSLSVFLLLEHQTLANNIHPCQPSNNKVAYDTFVRRHICFEKPKSDQEWKAHIQSIGGCNRPTQSFLSHLDLHRVRAVCTWNGGKVLEDNLCISRETFNFVTVQIDTGTCDIRSVTPETKHLILGCDFLPYGCLPVHFEANLRNLRPNYRARGCQAP